MSLKSELSEFVSLAVDAADWIDYMLFCGAFNSLDDDDIEDRENTLRLIDKLRIAANRSSTDEFWED